MRTFLLFAACLLARAEQTGIRITGGAQPDCWDVDSIIAGITKGAASEREKALALHKFGMAHMIHFNGPIEERGQYIDDPLKLLGVYGFALCGNNSKTMAALYNAAGMKARTRSMPGHSIPEVWFEGKWNYLDTDMFGYVFLEDGNRIASVDELAAKPELFTTQENPPDPFYPFDEKSAMAAIFRGAKASRNHHPYSNAHMMNLALRTGETIEFFYRPQGRYLLTELGENLGVIYKDYWVKGPVRKGSLAWTDTPPAAYGNALLEYAPDLRSAAFARENPLAANVRAVHEPRQPQLASKSSAHPASLVIEVSTPFVIVGSQNDLTDFEDNDDAAIVKGLFWRTARGDANRIFVSTDAGRNWKLVWENRHLGAIPFQVDLTKWVEGRYSYQVKFEWSGESGLEDLSLRTWLEVSPMGLPRLIAGSNRFRVTTAPRRTFYHESYWRQGQDLREQRVHNLRLSGGTYHVDSAASPGELTFRLGPDGVAEELRFSALIRAAGAIEEIALRLMISEDHGAGWRELARFRPDTEHSHNQMWFNNVSRDVALDGSKTMLRLIAAGAAIEKIIANTAVRTEPSTGPIEITHRWYEGDQLRGATRTVAPGASYELETAAGMRNHSLRLRVAE